MTDSSTPAGRPAPGVHPGTAPAAPQAPRSPLDAALERVGDRWSLLITEALLTGPRRFGELQGVIPGIAPNILTDRLRRLERNGVVVSAPYSQRPVRLAYRLTEDGAELAGVLRLLAAWGSGGTDAGEPLRHVACGTPVDARWYCPTCARVTDEPETGSLRYL
ncbi:MAG: helix-turn-helix domain-containing protein [Chloroflexota bacterium]